AGEQRAIGAAKAPAIDHCDGRLLIPAQTPPRAISLALSLADCAQALGFVLSEVFLKVHAGREGSAFAREDKHADIVAKFKLIEHVHHAAIEGWAHAVPLFWAIEFHPGDSVLDKVVDNVVFRCSVHAEKGRSL